MRDPNFTLSGNAKRLMGDVFKLATGRGSKMSTTTRSQTGLWSPFPSKKELKSYASRKISEPKNYLSFKKGGTVKKTGIYKLHKGEKVMTKNQHKKMTKEMKAARKRKMLSNAATKVMSGSNSQMSY